MLALESTVTAVSLENLRSVSHFRFSILFNKKNVFNFDKLARLLQLTLAYSKPSLSKPLLTKYLHVKQQLDTGHVDLRATYRLTYVEQTDRYRQTYRETVTQTDRQKQLL